MRQQQWQLHAIKQGTDLNTRCGLLATGDLESQTTLKTVCSVCSRWGAVCLGRRCRAKKAAAQDHHKLPYMLPLLCTDRSPTNMEGLGWFDPRSALPGDALSQPRSHGARPR